jgi:protein-tyrosine sulfotransferase
MKNIFIGGCGRSGTSFFQKVITSHSEIEGGPEFDFIQPLLSVYKNMISKFHLDRQKYFYSKTELDNAFKAFFNSCLSDRFKNSCTYFSEKTPNNIDVAKELLELFPDAYFINIIRDGRDVLASHKDAFKTASVCQLWNAAVDNYFNLTHNEEIKSRVINIRYEDFLTSPESVLLNVLDRLGLSIEPQMLKPGEIADKLVTDEIWGLKEMSNANFDSSKIGQWRNRLSYLEKKKAGKLMGPNLKKLGYL